MSLRLLYLIFVRLCGWLILLGRSSVDDALHLAYRPFDDSWFGHLDADPHTDTAFD